jgi:sugar-phosphatase
MTSFLCAAILFDLDGVLVDSTASVVRQWGVWARQRGIAEDKVAAVGHGVRAIEIIRSVAPHLDAEAEVQIMEKLEAEDQEGVAAVSGALELLRSIPEGRWCVVTSGTRHLALTRLGVAGISPPQILVTADDVVNGKPDPEPYLKGAELLGVNPAECLVIEDAPAGIKAAHAGGMKVVALASTYPASKLSEADVVVAKLDRIRVGSDGAEKLTVSIS